MQPQRAKDMLATYYDQNHNLKLDEGEFLTFEMGKDLEKINSHFSDIARAQAKIIIYNPTRPIHNNGRNFLAGRVEPTTDENSKVMFFEEDEGIWRLVDEAPVLGLQDPFYISNVQGWHIIGGVHFYPTDQGSNYDTHFYRYQREIFELFDEDGKVIEPFAKGPEGMKDIRLIDLENGRIAVFTRPQGGSAGPGRIAYTEIDSLEHLTQEIPRAEIIQDQFHPDEWGGANELHLLKNGKIGVLGHVAHYDGPVRHYYAMAFIFDPKSLRPSHMEILTTADDFPPIKPKKSELGKIIFSGGLTRHADGTADLYVGVGDKASGRIKIKDPFLKYEV